MVNRRAWLALRISGICSIVTGLLLTLIGATDLIEAVFLEEPAGVSPWLTLIAGILVASGGATVAAIVRYLRRHPTSEVIS